MSQMERIYKLDRLFRRRRPPSKHEIIEMFEISPAQFKRDLEYMRNRLGAPVTFDMEAGGYKYTAEEFNLPGLWFTEREVYSLLLMHSLLDQLQPDFVQEQLGPFKDKLRALLGKSGRGTQSILERMQVSAAPQRPVDPEHFQAICDATLRRKKLRMRYYSRSRGVESDRVVRRSGSSTIAATGTWMAGATRSRPSDGLRSTQFASSQSWRNPHWRWRRPDSRGMGSFPDPSRIPPCCCSIPLPRGGSPRKNGTHSSEPPHCRMAGCDWKSRAAIPRKSLWIF
jgi:hypothetical protein